MRLTKDQIEYILSAKASFETSPAIYAYLTSPKYTENTGNAPLAMTFDSFTHTISNHMRSKDPEGWPARIAEERRIRNDDILNKIPYANLFERIKKLNDIVNSPSATSLIKVAALKAIHDMMSEKDRNTAVKSSGATITISSDRLETARRFLN